MKKRWNVAMGVCFVAMGMVLSGCTAKADKTDRQAVTSSVVAQSENSASEVASSEVTSAVESWGTQRANITWYAQNDGG